MKRLPIDQELIIRLFAQGSHWYLNKEGKISNFVSVERPLSFDCVTLSHFSGWNWTPRKLNLTDNKFELVIDDTGDYEPVVKIEISGNPLFIDLDIECYRVNQDVWCQDALEFVNKNWLPHIRY